MDYKHAAEKELALLLQRYNKVAKTKMKTASIDIPEYILDILCQQTARNAEQKEILKEFRNNALAQLMTIGEQIHVKRLEKAKKAQEDRMEKDPRYIKHFGIWINSTLPTAKISRDHYAKINRHSSLYSSSYVKYLAENGDDCYVVDETGEGGLYSEEWCLSHRQNCLKNFDINMKRFESLDSDDFERVLTRFVKGRKFQEVKTLQEPICEQIFDLPSIVGCVYIMVLDAYKQAYIGITTNGVKNRIQQHWKKQREFDRLIFGSVESSVIAIDSFGPLDTTRLFVLPYSEDRKTRLEDYESICIKAFDNRYLLNRLR